MPVRTERQQVIAKELEAATSQKELPHRMQALRTLVNKWPGVLKVENALHNAERQAEEWTKWLQDSVMKIQQTISEGHFTQARQQLEALEAKTGPLDNLRKTIDAAMAQRAKDLEIHVTDLCTEGALQIAHKTIEVAKADGVDVTCALRVISNYEKQKAIDSTNTQFVNALRSRYYSEATEAANTLVELDNTTFSKQKLLDKIEEEKKREEEERKRAIYSRLELAEPDFEAIKTLCDELASRGFSASADTLRAQIAKRRKTWLRERVQPVQNLKATPSSEGQSKVHLSWKAEPSKLASGYSVTRVSVKDDSKKSWSSLPASSLEMTDDSPALGVEYRYFITPLVDEEEVLKATIWTPVVVCTSNVTNFHATASEGKASFGIVRLEWENPPWDAAAFVSTEVTREDGQVWDVSGKNALDDTSVHVGETHRYELVVTVAGKKLEPVSHEVTVKELTDIPVVDSLRLYRKDNTSFRVIWNWPDGVDTVNIQSDNGLELAEVSREEYDKKVVTISPPQNTKSIQAQSFRRLGGYLCEGPLSQPTIIPGYLGSVNWSVCQAPSKSAGDKLRFWKKRPLCIQTTIRLRVTLENEYIPIKVFRVGEKECVCEYTVPCNNGTVLWQLPPDKFASGDRLLIKAPTGFEVHCDSFDSIP